MAERRCGRPPADDRDGWRARALGMREILDEKRAEIARLTAALAEASHELMRYQSDSTYDVGVANGCESARRALEESRAALAASEARCDQARAWSARWKASAQCARQDATTAIRLAEDAAANTDLAIKRYEAAEARAEQVVAVMRGFLGEHEDGCQAGGWRKPCTCSEIDILAIVREHDAATAEGRDERPL